MNILEIENGCWVKVVDFQNGRGIEKQLSQMGFLPGNKIRVIRSAPFKGPLLIEAEGREIVLGRGIARKIIVEYL